MSAEKWWFYKPVITVCDVLDAGACYLGVKDYVQKHGNLIAAPCVAVNSNYTDVAGNGYGYGYGDGNGYGYGYGYGDGDGDGNGNGYGDGNGNGDGYGYGYGYGN